MNKDRLLMQLERLKADLIELDQACGMRTTPADIAALLGAIRPMTINIEHGLHDRHLDHAIEWSWARQKLDEVRRNAREEALEWARKQIAKGEAF